LLDEADVAVVAGTSFGAGGEGHIRISCAASLYELKEAVRRIETFLGPV
jgi:aminotransferase